MPIEGVHSISGRGTVVTGLIERGTVRPGDEVEIVGLRETRLSVVTSVETYQKILDVGEAGDNVSCLLRAIDRDAVERGQVPYLLRGFECRRSHRTRRQRGGLGAVQDLRRRQGDIALMVCWPRHCRNAFNRSLQGDNRRAQRFDLRCRTPRLLPFVIAAGQTTLLTSSRIAKILDSRRGLPEPLVSNPTTSPSEDY